MAIKRIPIKGISRDPSGQISAEGMCAESLNVQLDMGEIAPMMRPKQVTDFGDISVNGDILYIHKGIGYENLICLSGTRLYAYQKNSETELELYSYTVAPTIKSITHVGNTVILGESDTLRYFLFKDGDYKHLGTKIPIPSIWFGANHVGILYNVSGLREDASARQPGRFPDGQGGTHYVYDAKVEQVEYPIGSLSPDDWAMESTKYTVKDESALKMLEQIWGVIDEKIDENIQAGKALFPLFIRYAVRLYDDSLYACSTPILLGADIEKMLDVKLWSVTNGNTYSEEAGRPPKPYWDMYSCVGLPMPYKIMADFTESQLATLFQDWDDIVKGVDFFISDQVVQAARQNEIKLSDRVEVIDEQLTPQDWGYMQAWANGTLYAGDNMEEVLIYHSQTYLAKSIKLEDFSGHTGPETWDDINLSSDWILNQEAIKEGYLSNHQFISDNLASYNNALMILGATLRVGPGHPYLQSSAWVEKPSGMTTPDPWYFVFHIKINQSETIIAAHAPDGAFTIRPKLTDDCVYPYSTDYYEKPVAWIAYPDSRCVRVDVLRRVRSNLRKVASYSMRPMATADVAYCFIGFGEAIPVNEEGPIYIIDERPLAKLPNVLIQSKVSNPFITTPGGVVTLSGDIINIGIVTTPLSEGQVGQFPLYVFTSEGVFSLTVDGTGAFKLSDAVSRDILLHKYSIIAIEQAIFFVSNRGLMLLQGSSVTKVSELMDGHPDSLSNDLAQSIASRFFSGVPINETGPFYQFLNGCRMAYDYANARIILFREEQSDMYVYKFNTQSWHRMAWNPLSTPVRTLNSYPEAFIVEKDEDGVQSLMNYSVLAEEPNAVPLSGLIYTRELSLDEQDLYKTINRLKIRGRYKDGNVKWALQGSNDGVNYRTLHSLRGPSWKWYRIAIVTMLDVQERISYIELDYTPKFTNRLR